MVRFRILGSVEAHSDDRRMRLGGPRQVRLLAFLVLNANWNAPSDS